MMDELQDNPGTEELDTGQASSPEHYKARLTLVIDPHNFWAQIGTDVTFAQFASFEDDLQSYCEDLFAQVDDENKEESTRYARDFILVKSPHTQRWMRAVVAHVTSGMMDLFYLDYGTTELVSVSCPSVVNEVSKFATHRVQAFRCQLAAIKPLAKQWTSRATRVLQTYIATGTLDLFIPSRLEGVVTVALYTARTSDDKGRSLSHILVDNEVAMPDYLKELPEYWDDIPIDWLEVIQPQQAEVIESIADESHNGDDDVATTTEQESISNETSEQQNKQSETESQLNQLEEDDDDDDVCEDDDDNTSEDEDTSENDGSEYKDAEDGLEQNAIDVVEDDKENDEAESIEPLSMSEQMGYNPPMRIPSFDTQVGPQSVPVTLEVMKQQSEQAHRENALEEDLRLHKLNLEEMKKARDLHIGGGLPLNPVDMPLSPVDNHLLDGPLSYETMRDSDQITRNRITIDDEPVIENSSPTHMNRRSKPPRFRKLDDSLHNREQHGSSHRQLEIISYNSDDEHYIAIPSSMTLNSKTRPHNDHQYDGYAHNDYDISHSFLSRSSDAIREQPIELVSEYPKPRVEINGHDTRFGLSRQTMASQYGASADMLPHDVSTSSLSGDLLQDAAISMSDFESQMSVLLDKFLIDDPDQCADEVIALLTLVSDTDRSDALSSSVESCLDYAIRNRDSSMDLVLRTIEQFRVYDDFPDVLCSGLWRLQTKYVKVTSSRAKVHTSYHCEYGQLMGCLVNLSTKWPDHESSPVKVCAITSLQKWVIFNNKNAQSGADKLVQVFMDTLVAVCRLAHETFHLSMAAEWQNLMKDIEARLINENNLYVRSNLVSLLIDMLMTRSSALPGEQEPAPPPPHQQRLRAQELRPLQENQECQATVDMDQKSCQTDSELCFDVGCQTVTPPEKLTEPVTPDSELMNHVYENEINPATSSAICAVESTVYQSKLLTPNDLIPMLLKGPDEFTATNDLTPRQPSSWSDTSSRSAHPLVSMTSYIGYPAARWQQSTDDHFLDCDHGQDSCSSAPHAHHVHNDSFFRQDKSDMMNTGEYGVSNEKQTIVYSTSGDSIDAHEFQPKLFRSSAEIDENIHYVPAIPPKCLNPQRSSVLPNQPISHFSAGYSDLNKRPAEITLGQFNKDNRPLRNSNNSYYAKIVLPSYQQQSQSTFSREESSINTSAGRGTRSVGNSSYDRSSDPGTDSDSGTQIGRGRARRRPLAARTKQVGDLERSRKFGDMTSSQDSLASSTTSLTESHDIGKWDTTIESINSTTSDVLLTEPFQRANISIDQREHLSIDNAASHCVSLAEHKTNTNDAQLSASFDIAGYDTRDVTDRQPNIEQSTDPIQGQDMSHEPIQAQSRVQVADGEPEISNAKELRKHRRKQRAITLDSILTNWLGTDTENQEKVSGSSISNTSFASVVRGSEDKKLGQATGGVVNVSTEQNSNVHVVQDRLTPFSWYDLVEEEYGPDEARKEQLFDRNLEKSQPECNKEIQNTNHISVDRKTVMKPPEDIYGFDVESDETDDEWPNIQEGSRHRPNERSPVTAVPTPPREKWVPSRKICTLCGADSHLISDCTESKEKRFFLN